jgi:hypothetical protein
MACSALGFRRFTQVSSVKNVPLFSLFHGARTLENLVNHCPEKCIQPDNNVRRSANSFSVLNVIRQVYVGS